MAELLIALEVHCKVSAQLSKPGYVYQAVKHSCLIVMLYKFNDMYINLLFLGESSFFKTSFCFL